MTTATISEVKSHLAEFIKASENEPIILTRKGKPVAVLLGGKNDEDIERLLMACSPKLRRILNRAESQIRAGRGIPSEEFWAKVDAEYKRPRRGVKSALPRQSRKKAG